MPKTLEQEAAELRQQVEQEAAELRQQLDAPKRAQERLREIEAQLALQKEEGVRKTAEKRVVAISRAAGSVAAELDDDATRVLDAANAYAEAVRRYNERFRKYEGLQLENAALTDRFGVKGAKVPSVLAPERNQVAIKAAQVVTTVAFIRETWFVQSEGKEKCEHGLRQRRTYAEVLGTPSFAIICEAGLKPFPELTDGQRERLDEQARDAAQAAKEMAQYAVEIERALAPSGDGSHLSRI